jgi:hypothetical protein
MGKERSSMSLQNLPGDYIRALESGLPSSERNKRWIVICQAYFDASGMGSKEPNLIIAGFLSSSEVWAEFADTWKAELDTPPRIDCFKFAKHYKDKRLEDKICNLTQIIRSFPLVRVNSYIDWGEFNQFIIKTKDNKNVLKIPLGSYTLEIKKSNKRRFDHPYWLCFHHIIVETIADQIKHNLKTPIEFIFDEEDALGLDCLMWYNYFKKYTFPKWVLPYLGSPPSFKNDDKIMPLQAADLYAGLLRYSLIENQILSWPHPKELKLIEEMPEIGGPISLKGYSMLMQLTNDDIREITKKAVEIGKREKEEIEKRKWEWLTKEPR